MPVITTGGANDVRIRMDQGGLVRDLTWVAQRVEATDYNAYFLFSKDLGPPTAPATLLGPTPLAPVQSPCDIPWWPNAQIPNWDYGDGYIRPAFVDRRSDPIWAAKMSIRGMTRFEHEGPSIFRSLIPILNCKRAPLIDRYIYRYDFGFWPTGGLAEARLLPIDDIRGYSNWDKLPKRELSLTMNQDNTLSEWVVDTTQQPITTVGSTFTSVDSSFSHMTVGFLVKLVGAHPNRTGDALGNNGNGAVVLGILDFNQIRNLKGYIGLYLRTNHNGSASLVAKTTEGYQWLAVAASGGYGIRANGGGGKAGSAVEIGWQGANTARTHEGLRNTDGIIIYSNLSDRDRFVIQTQGDPARLSPPFLFPIAGTIQNLQLTFSLAASLPTEPLVSISISVSPNVNPAGNRLLPPITTYNLVAPTTNITVPVPKVWDISGLDISVNAGEYVIVTFVVNINPNIFIINKTTLRVVKFGFVGATIRAKSSTISDLNVIYGGAGGGRNASAGVGLPDGIQMPTTASFVESHDQTGGTINKYYGGDGYYGGGSGTQNGGGGGSYVSDLLLQVNTFEDPIPSDVSITLTPLTKVSMPQPNFNIYSWVTRYNRLRINSGRGGLMFNDVT